MSLYRKCTEYCSRHFTGVPLEFIGGYCATLTISSAFTVYWYFCL